MAYHVYRCYDAYQRLLYIGATRDLFGRLATHRASSWWAPHVAAVRARVYPDQVTARRIERDAIAREQPRCNIQHRWTGVNRENWTPDDYRDFAVALVMGDNGTARKILPTRLRRVAAEYHARFGTPLGLDELHGVPQPGERAGRAVSS